MSQPQSFLALDPGKVCGVAWLEPGANSPSSETWRFKHSDAGVCYLQFIQRVSALLKHLPDVQIGIELMTVVSHGEGGRVDAKQVQLSSGWPNCLAMMRAQRDLRPIEQIPIQTWRSRTHRKTFAPKEMKIQSDRSKFLKQAAVDWCFENGWDFATSDEAEALCMLDYLRQEYDPSHKFEAGFGGHQETLL